MSLKGWDHRGLLESSDQLSVGLSISFISDLVHATLLEHTLSQIFLSLSYIFSNTFPSLKTDLAWKTYTARQTIVSLDLWDNKTVSINETYESIDCKCCVNDTRQNMCNLQLQRRTLE